MSNDDSESNRSKVTIVQREWYQYPTKESLFRPSEAYPEYLFKPDIAKDRNEVYDMVRNCFYLAGYDKERYGTQDWNPLGQVIKKGNTVLIKPNFVMDNNPSGDGIECLYTQPGVIAAVVDYVLIALGGNTGRIVIGDAPMQYCDFEKLVKQSGLDVLVDYYIKRNVVIELVDFRGLISVKRRGLVTASISDAKDAGQVINLANDSEFAEMSSDQNIRMRVTNYDPRILVKHHQNDCHEYYISKYLLQSDVIINMPKPKTHRKAGVTIALKNMIGVCTRKEYLPHHMLGAKESGLGDEYLHNSIVRRITSKCYDKLNMAIFESNIVKIRYYNCEKIMLGYFKRLFCRDDYSEGSWYGNDTISRSIVDVNKIVFYANKEGMLCNTKQREYLIVADMIQSGENEGPLMPNRKNVGIIAMGSNPVCFDEIIAEIMGAVTSLISTIARARHVTGHYSLVSEDQIGFVISDNVYWHGRTMENVGNSYCLSFKPTTGWKKVFRIAQYK